MIKYRLTTGVISIILVLSIVFGLYLYLTAPPNERVSKEIHIATLTSDDSMYYSNNIQSITNKDLIYTFWVEDGKITYSKINNQGDILSINQLSTNLNKPKKIQVIAENEVFNIYVLEDIALKKYVVDINDNTVITTTKIKEEISDFILIDGYSIFHVEGILKVLNDNNEILYTSEPGVSEFECTFEENQLHLVYKVKEKNNSYIKYMTFDSDEIRLVNTIKNVELNSSSLEDIKIGANGEVGILFQKDNRAKNTTFVYALISLDEGNTFSQYFHSANFMSIDLQFESINETEYSLYEVYKGNIYLATYKENNNIGAAKLTNTSNYSTNINVNTIGKDLYFQWSEKDDEGKSLYFASTNENVITKSVELKNNDKLLILFDTLIILATTLIPMFLLLVYIGVSVGILILILKLIFKDDIENKTKLITRIVGFAYLVLVGGYLLFYLEHHYEMNIYSKYINEWQFIIINVAIVILAYFCTKLKMKSLKLYSHFDKLINFMILEFVFVSLFTMPNIIMSWFGRILFY